MPATSSNLFPFDETATNVKCAKFQVNPSKGSEVLAVFVKWSAKHVRICHFEHL